MFLPYSLDLPDAGLNLFNVLITSIIISMVGLVAGYCVRKQLLSLRHGLLCMALVATFVSPILSGLGGNQGHGLVTIQLNESTSDPDSNSASSSARMPQPFVEGRRELERLPAMNPKESANSRSAALSGEVAGPPANRSSWRISSFPTNPAIWLALTWASGAAFASFRTLRGLKILRQLRRSMRPSSNPRLIEAAQQAFSVVGQDIHTPVCESPLAPVPLTFGWWKSSVIVPEGLADLLDDEQLVSVLVHEAAHVGRRDNVFALLQELAGIVFWWNPIVHRLNHQIEVLREQICDDYVVKHFGNGLPLAHAIIKVIETSAVRSTTCPLVTTLVDGYEAVETRITRLAEQGRPVSIKLNRRSSMMVGVFTVALYAIAWNPIVRTEVLASPKDDVVESAGWKVLVRAVDTKGNPISNAKFGVQLGYNGTPKWVDGGKDGLAIVSVSEQNPKYCALLSRADGFVTMHAIWQKGLAHDDGLPAEYTFELLRATTVGGTIVNEKGEPVAGAQVEFTAEGSRSTALQPLIHHCYKEVSKTNKDGEWRCKTSPVDIENAWISVVHPDYFIDKSSSVGQPITDRINDLMDYTHTWTLKKGFRVTGRVVNENDEPIPGASLAICRANVPTSIPVQKTDAEGKFAFDRIEVADTFGTNDPISLTITVLKPGFAPTLETVPGFGNRPLDESSKQERICNFTLTKGVPLTLKIVDSKNNPVPKAWINPASWHDTRGLETLRQHGLPELADEKGIWRWDDAPPGQEIKFSIDAREFSMETNHAVKIEESGTEETIVLKRAQIILGTAIDAKTKKPIPKFVVEHAFENVGGFPDGLYWTGQPIAGKEGKYRGAIKMVPHNGRYTYRAVADGYEPAVSESTPFGEGEKTIDFKLQPVKK